MVAVKNNTEPTKEYITAVKKSLKDDERFVEDKEGEVRELLAFSSWRHDWPLPKAFFESKEIKFSDENSKALDDFIAKLKIYEDEKDKGEFNLDNFAEHPVSHKHGDKSHSHHGGESSHTHDNMPGAYSKGESSSNNQEEQMFREDVAVALGLEKTASKEDITKAIKTSKEAAFTDTERTSLQELKNNARIVHYMSEVEAITLAPGTQREKAEKLVKLENIDPALAKERLEDWTAMHTAADAAGVTVPLLASYSETADKPKNERGPAEVEIAKYAEDNKVNFNVGLAQVSMRDLDLFVRYTKEIEAK